MRRLHGGGSDGDSNGDGDSVCLELEDEGALCLRKGRWPMLQLIFPSGIVRVLNGNDMICGSMDPFLTRCLPWWYDG
jgi:hypothetical protein